MHKKLSIIIVMFLISITTLSIPSYAMDETIETDIDSQDLTTENNKPFEKITNFFSKVVDFIKSLNIFSIFDHSNDKEVLNQNDFPLLNDIEPISINKTDHLDESAYVEAGDIIDYTVIIKNPTINGMQDQVYVIDTLPENVTFLQEYSPEWNYDAQGHYAYIVYESLLPNQTKILNLSVQVNPNIIVPCMLNNSVKVNSSILGYNSAYERTAVGPGVFEALDIYKDDRCQGRIQNPTVDTPQFINYTITIQNQNMLDVHNVTIRDKLFPGVHFEDASHNGNPENINGDMIVFWGFERLETNQTLNLWLNVSVDPTVQPGTWIENNAYVICDETRPNEGHIIERTLVLESNMPQTSLEIGQPKKPISSGTYVRLTTPLKFHAIDAGDPNNASDPPYWTGVQNITYDITWYDEYDNPMYLGRTVIMDNSPNDLNESVGIIDAVIFFNESCKHKLTFWSTDKSGNQEFSQTEMFYVDETPPNLKTSFSGYIDHYFYYHGTTWYTGISRSTWVNLIAEGTGTNHDNGCNGGVGFDHLTYRWYAGDEMDDLEKITETTSISPTVSLTFYQSLWHRLEFWTMDELNNRNPGGDSYNSIDFLIDDTGPETESYFTGPFIEDAYGIDWITSNTKKIIEATDSGGIPGGSGVEKINWHVDKKIRDEWMIIDQGVIYDNDLMDLDGSPAQPLQGNIGGIYGFDNKAEPFIFHDSNGNWSYDEGETIYDYDPDGDGFIQQYNASPMKGDKGGLWAMDAANEPYLFQDRNNNWVYDENDTIPYDPVHHSYIDPDEDAYINNEWISKYLAEPMYGDIGGLYAWDDQHEPFVFQDTHDASNWKYDVWWDEQQQSWAHEPLVTLKPDYDGKGTITMELSVQENGEHRIYYQAYDRLGNPGPEHNQYVKIDNTPPTSEIITGDPHCGFPTICVTTDTRITLTTNDQFPPCAVGLDTLHYMISKNNITLEERQIPQSEYYFYFNSYGQGLYNVTWFATDLLGNTEPIQYQTYCVDNTPPAVEITIEQPRKPGSDHEPDFWITKEANVTIQVTQVGTWIDYISLDTYFRINKGAWIPINSDEALDPNGVQIPLDYFETEQRYEIEIEAGNCYLPSVIARKVVYVDNSPPDLMVMNPSDGGYYAENDLISCVVFAEDLPKQPLQSEPVGISQGKAGNAVLIDVYPDFAMLPLMNVDFMFDPENEGSPFFQGDFRIIGSESVLNDGPVLFIVEIEDDLGNGQNTLVDVLYDFYQQADGDETLFRSLINAEEGIAEAVVWLIIDNDGGGSGTQPSGEVDEVFFNSPTDDSIIDDSSLDLRLQATGDADPQDISVIVTITVEGYHTFTEQALYDQTTDEFIIEDFDISFFENDSVLSFHATASTTVNNTVESTDDPEVIINNMVYFSQYLQSGWNTVIFDQLPDDTNVTTVFASILDDISLIFEMETGGYFIPGQSLNFIDHVVSGHDYKIKMNNDKPLYLTDM